VLKEGQKEKKKEKKKRKKERKIFQIKIPEKYV
jgi:hypothetical protein